MKIRKIEFWIATAVVAVILYVTIKQSLGIINAPVPPDFIIRTEKAYAMKGLSYSYLTDELIPNILRLLTIYGAFAFILYVVGRYFPLRDYNRISVLSFLAAVVAALLLALAKYINERATIPGYFSSVIEVLPQTLAIFGLILLYQLVRGGLVRLFTPVAERSALSRRLRRELLIAAGIWTAVMFLLVMYGHGNEPWVVWLTLAPLCYALYMVHVYWLIPDFDRIKRQARTVVVREISVCLPLFTLFLVLATFIDGHRGHTGAWFVIFLLATVIMVGLSWFIYNRNREQIRELLRFKQQLGQATSSLQLLRAQINPHFLFNALNTLYGTALQENAERTGEGIQKLGDMMRFMLHENMQDNIPIARELQYIRDYIALQRLRIRASDDITVETEIVDPLDDRRITPMLLIPFVENAFKHGISLVEKSWIRISLRFDENALYFDAYNSIHRAGAWDPEHARSGLGLENVKQRLEMLYPGRYELVIRETAREYFVHLTLRVCAPAR